MNNNMAKSSPSAAGFFYRRIGGTLFKGRDADVLAQAFKEFVYGNEKKKGRVSLREKLKHFKEAVSQDKNRERSREKNKDRGQSL